MAPRKHSNRQELQVRPIPLPVTAHHPPPPIGDDVLPYHEFTAGLIAPKGSGKTTLICNILKFYQGYFHVITVFSPTLHCDEKWETVRRLPLLAENTQLVKFLKKKGQSENPVVGRPSIIDQGNKPFNPHIPDSHFISEYDESTLDDMLTEQRDMIKEIEGLGGTKHLANRWLIIFDDLVGSTLFSNKRQSVFKMLNTNHGHASASLLLVSQAYREIPKTVRVNLTALILFEVTNESELKALYEENTCGMTWEVWVRAYRYCTEQDYDFMYINYKKPKKLRVMKNFDQYIFLDN
ncbi:hypothetical protein BC832DRAFT_537596 [Gaertneriomyces semiglobifer]|nr:hypothetical protein BC832DRAFT_596348 [Gaertneriomyces semiglobifer]KAI9015226.1 hypothetical protein BC832DRAFT_537596 [Gaertneriomyces semiglobifer]